MTIHKYNRVVEGLCRVWYRDDRVLGYIVRIMYQGIVFSILWHLHCGLHSLRTCRVAGLRVHVRRVVRCGQR